MPHIEWTAELELGIPVIDGQHHRIVDYINEIHALDGDERATLQRIVDDLIDYTYSHFAFEETLMEEAGYEALAIHRETHNAFRRRVNQLKARFSEGEDIAGGLASLLETWLIHHIQNDDSNYAPLVREQMRRLRARQNGSWLKNTLGRFFRQD